MVLAFVPILLEAQLFTNRLLTHLVFLFLPIQIFAQSTVDLEDFNSAYLEYGNTRDSNPEMAREAARRAYSIGRRIFGGTNERTAMLAVNYAILLQDEAESQEVLDEAVTIYQEIFGFGNKAMIDPLSNLGQMLADFDRIHLATQYYARSLQLGKAHLGENASKVGAISLELGALALRAEQFDTAYARITDARKILRSYFDAGSRSNLVRANLILGDYFLKTKQYEQAVEPLLTALQWLSHYPKADLTLQIRVALIEAYENLGMSEESTEHCLSIGSSRRVRGNERLRPLYTVELDTAELAEASYKGNDLRVAFTVDKEGFVRDPVVIGNVDNEILKTHLLHAVRKFRFAPRFVDGDAVVTRNQEYVFRN